MSKKLLAPLILLVIVLGAIFLRTYHYNDWLFFKWDQARDAILLAPAIQHGPEHLPLLGPRATKINGDYLRLGPIYYYIQYATGVIFNSVEPQIFAYSDLVFSILSILLLYVFLRIYFSQKISLLATSLYAFSFLIIQYSRFSWNPNAVPFFTLLTFYGLLRFSSATNFKNRLKWLALWALGFAIASQYHFFAFFVLTGVSGLFISYYLISNHLVVSASLSVKNLLGLLRLNTFKKIGSVVFSKNSFFYTLTTVLIFGFLYTPVIISDIQTHGSNTKLFFRMFDESGRKDKPFGQKLIRNFREQGDNYALITTSFKHRSGMKADPLTVGFGLFIIISGLLIIKNELIFKKEDIARRNFLILMLIWITTFFIITIPASYQLRPRYFVPVFGLPFIIIALWYSILEKKIVRHYNFLIIFITLLFLGSNAYGINQWFNEQANSQSSNFKTYRTLILRHRDGITLKQLKSASAYLQSENTSSGNSKNIVYSTPTEYYLPFIYLLNLSQASPTTIPQPIKTISGLENRNVVYIINNGKTKSANKKLKPYLEEISHKQFGQLFVHKMEVINKEKLAKAILINNEKQEQRKLEKDSTSNADKKTARLFWRDIFGTNDNLEEILISK